MCTADEEAARSFESFVAMIERLRAPDGCPWDRVQTHASIAGNMVEEAYEAVGAIEENNVAGLAEELGDVLLQVVLQSQIASENGEFDIGDVIAGISDKIVRRHPHVFGDTAGAGASAGAGAATAGAGAATPTEVHRRWDEIKRAEKASAGKGALDEVPFSLPALTLSQVISRKAVAAGFEWEALSGVWDKLDEELAELKATEPGSEEAVEELGDVLFTTVNLARKQGIDAESALRAACVKFRGRWREMEAQAIAQGRDVAGLSSVEREMLWQKAKEKEGRS